MKTSNRKSNAVLCLLLLVLVPVKAPAVAATPSEIDAAIGAGLEWLVAQQNLDGSWDSWVEETEFQAWLSPTAFAVIKLGEYARELGYDSPFDPNYLYHEAIDKGLEYIFQRAEIVDINNQPAGNPDSDGDGNGVCFGDSLWLRTYDTGIVMMAIAATRSPDRIVAVPSSAVNGWTYKEVLDDVVDYMAFGQTDDPPGRGGWGYLENGSDDDPEEPCTTYSDNSNTGFAVLGLAYAESASYRFNCVIPPFVRSELNIWIDYIQADHGCNQGGSGYDEPNEWVNAMKTGNLIFEMAFYGDGPGVPRMQDALDYLARIWNHPTGDPGLKGPPPQYQAMYCIMKGLEYRGIDGILTYPVAQNVICDVDVFEVNGLGTGHVDIEAFPGELEIVLGLFDSNGTLTMTVEGEAEDEPGFSGIVPDAGVVRFGITGEDDYTFRGWHGEMGTYQIAVWPSGAPSPSEPTVDEVESNNEFSERNVFASTGQLVINGELGEPECFEPEGEPVVIDWYDDLASVIVATQNPDGSWPADMWGASGDSVLTTAWALLTLEKITPPVAMIYGQCVLAGEPFEPTPLDEGVDPCNPGIPPYTWIVMGAEVLTVEIDANNVMTVTYPEGWIGSETLTLICVDSAQQTYIIPYPHPTYAVCAQPVVLDIPNQTYPFEPFDLDAYLDPECGLEPNEVEWSVSGVSGGWIVEIDANNVVTVTAPQGANEPATLTFTATSTVCICAEPSDSDDATFGVFAGQIEARMKFTPQRLNCSSEGNWVKAHFILPESFGVDDVDVNTPATIDSMGIESDYINVFTNEDGLVEIEIGFERAAFCGVTDYGPVEVTVIGKLMSGQDFYGTDTIRITE